MSIIRANLKLYSPFQSRSNFYSYFMFLIFIIYPTYNAISGIKEAVQPNQSYLPEPDIGTFTFFLYFVSITLTRIQLHILTIPFSYCLPNHRYIPRKMILIMGFISSIIFSLILFFIYPSLLTSKIHIITILFLGLAVYLLGSYMTVRFEPDKNKAFIMGLIPLTIYGIFWDMFWEFITPSIGHFIIFYFIPLLLFSTILFISLWKKMGHPNFKRERFERGCSTIFYNYAQQSSTFVKQMLNKLPEKVLKENRSDNYFLNKFKNQPFFSLNKSITGSLYCMMDRNNDLDKYFIVIPLPLNILIQTFLMFIISFIVLFNIFETPGLLTYCNLLFFLIFPCITISRIFEPVLNNHLLPVKREDYFKKSIILWLAKPAIVILWFCLVVFIISVFKYLLSDWSLEGHGFIYISLGLSSILWILVVISVLDTFTLYSNKTYKSFSTIIPIGLIALLTLLSIFTDNPEHRLIYMFLAALSCNVFFINKLFHHWFREDLNLLN